MTQPDLDNGRNRFKRYRDNKRRRGMRLLRMWVPDLHASDFAVEAVRQAVIINGAADAVDVMDFVAHAADWGTER